MKYHYVFLINKIFSQYTGENVPLSEQSGSKDEGKLNSNLSTSKVNISEVVVNDHERAQFDEERNRLYEVIDEKVLSNYAYTYCMFSA